MKDRIVETEYGLVEGITGWDPRIIDFKGIPFAAPPVGPLRWKAPQPHEKWEGIYKADHYGPISVQSVPGEDPAEFWTREIHPTGPEFTMSEDCLYLNVFTPARTGDENLPVLCYIHGGGFQGGYPYEVEFDWEHMARKGMVVVAVTYRLGLMGFFAHPELSAEDPEAAKGNYGIQDQIFALEWIRKNIRGFGGDPSRVTIAGQSAGAMSVQGLMICDQAKPLFTGAICESTIDGGQKGMPQFMKPLSETEAYGKEMLEKAGITFEDARRMPAEEFLKLESSTLGRGIHFQPALDDVLYSVQPWEAFRDNTHAQVPVLCGFNRGETQHGKFGGGEYTMADLEQVFSSYGDAGKELRSMVRAENDSDAAALFRTDDYNAPIIANWKFGVTQARAGLRAYLYEFDAPIPGEDNAGSYHGSEMWFAYDGLARCWRPFEGKHYDLARQVSSYWTNFIKCGDPNGKDTFGNELPEWEPFSNENQFMLLIGEKPEKSGNHITPIMKWRIEHEI